MVVDKQARAKCSDPVNRAQDRERTEGQHGDVLHRPCSSMEQEEAGIEETDKHFTQ